MVYGYYYMKQQNSSRLAGNPNWGTATVVGIFAGMLYGGSKEASASVVCLLSIYKRPSCSLIFMFRFLLSLCLLCIKLNAKISGRGFETEQGCRGDVEDG